jgi:hypothetical protein
LVKIFQLSDTKQNIINTLTMSIIIITINTIAKVTIIIMKKSMITKLYKRNTITHGMFKMLMILLIWTKMIIALKIKAKPIYVQLWMNTNILWAISVHLNPM